MFLLHLWSTEMFILFEISWSFKLKKIFFIYHCFVCGTNEGASKSECSTILTRSPKSQLLTFLTLACGYEEVSLAFMPTFC